MIIIISVDIHGPISKAGNKYMRKILYIVCSNIIRLTARSKQENDIEFLTNVYYEDMVYSIKSTILAQKISYGEFIFYNYYRNRDGSIMSTPSIKRCTDMYKMLENVMKLYEITPDEYKPYLMSFIRNETKNTIEKIDIILNSIENGDLLKTMPKRNYKLDFGKLNGLQGEMKHAN